MAILLPFDGRKSGLKPVFAVTNLVVVGFMRCFHAYARERKGQFRILLISYEIQLVRFDQSCIYNERDFCLDKKPETYSAGEKSWCIFF